jgi:hypothetical protein
MPTPCQAHPLAVIDDRLAHVVAHLPGQLVTPLVTDLGVQQAGHAARLRPASSTSTETSREQPGSCMVTPIRWSAISMVTLLWVMKMNWT